MPRILHVAKYLPLSLHGSYRIATQWTISAPTVQAIDEYMDRKCYLIIHNIPEDNSSQDHEKAGSLFESEFEVPKSCMCNVSGLVGHPVTRLGNFL